MIIDSHVHFWKYHPVKDAWITDEMMTIKRDFLAEDVKPVFAEHGVSGCIAVQADQSEKENQFLVEQATNNAFIKGIVGWVDFKLDSIEERLEYYSNIPAIKGFRHIVQAESAGFLQNEKFTNGIRLLGNYQFTYDLLIYHHQLKEAIGFVKKFPDQVFILDHCAKPGIKQKEIREWKANLKELAQHNKLYCKLSGLLTEADWKTQNADDLKPYLDTVFEVFSTDRIIYGSDWPVMLLAGKYDEWLTIVNECLKHFSDADRKKVFSGNAIEAYKLNVN